VATRAAFSPFLESKLFVTVNPMPQKKSAFSKTNISRLFISIFKNAAAILSVILLLLLIRQGMECVRVPFFKYNGPFEGQELIAAVRIMEQKTLYPDYADHDLYYMYGPLLPVLYATVMKFFGARLMVLKIAAFMACLLVVGGVARGSYRLTKSKWGVLWGIGTFCALYRFSGLWFFNVRPDIFATALSLWGLIFADQYLQGKDGDRPGLIAALLFSLAALSKQNYLILPVGYIGAVLLGRSFKSALKVSAPFLLVIVPAAIWFNTGGEHFFKMTMLFSGQPFDKLIPAQLGAVAAPFILSLIAVWLLFRMRKAGENRLVWVLFAGMSLIIGQSSFMKIGGGQYAFTFFCAVISVLTAVALVKTEGLLSPASRVVFLSILLFFNAFLINEADFFVRRLKYVFGYSSPENAYLFIRDHRHRRVYFPQQNYVTYLAADQYYHNEIIDLDLGWVGLEPPKSIVRKLESRYFDLIVGDFYAEKLKKLRDAKYKLAGHIKPDAIAVYVRK